MYPSLLFHPPPPPSLRLLQKEQVIRAEQEAAEPVVLPSAPSESRQEKIGKAQVAMQFRGRAPELESAVLAEKLEKLRVSTNSSEARNELDTLADQVEREIAEREVFLQDMAAAGQEKQFEKQIQLEIADRKRELEKINKLREDRAKSNDRT